MYLSFRISNVQHVPYKPPRCVFRGLCCAFYSIAILTPIETLAQDSNGATTLAAIRKEEFTHSEIMHTLHYLADLFGPRLTGSPNEKAAADWAMNRMSSWGLEKAHLEPWLFGHPGWSNKLASGYIVAPVHDQLYFIVAAWTPSTEGDLAADAVVITPPEEPKS